MGKGLAIVGIVAAVAATLSMLVLVSAAVFLVIPVIIAGSIALVMQRSVAGAVAGLLVLALGVVATLGLAGSVTTENGVTDFGFSESGGRLMAIAGCLAVPLGAIVVRWDKIDPQALAYVGIFCAAVAFLLGAANPGLLVNQTSVIAIAAGLLPLGAIVSMVGLLRGSDAEEQEAAYQ